MIEINLLPDEIKARKKAAVDWAEIPLLPMAAMIIAALIGINAVSVFFAERFKGDVASRKKELKGLMPKKLQVEALQKKLRDMNSKVDAIEDLTENRIVWARKLNSISDSILPNIWLSGLSHKKGANGNILILEGFATGSSEEGTALVGKLITSLEMNDSFFNDFRMIQLDSINSKMIEKNEVMNFKLSCFFKDQKPQKKSKK